MVQISPLARRPLFAAWKTLCLASLAIGCATVELEDVSIPAPVPEGSCVVIGFLGGLDRWNDETKGARRLALDLRQGPRFTETLENRRLDIATEVALRSLDADRDRSLSPAERARARLVIYGQSLGGGAATLLAWRLASWDVPVALLLLVDSVSPWDEPIPPNVRLAAVLFQDDGWFIRGESFPQAADSAGTAFVFEEFDYDRPPGSEISIRDLPWWKTASRVAHSRMDRDPRVWTRAGALSRAACGR